MELENAPPRHVNAVHVSQASISILSLFTPLHLVTLPEHGEVYLPMALPVSPPSNTSLSSIDALAEIYSGTSGKVCNEIGSETVTSVFLAARGGYLPQLGGYPMGVPIGFAHNVAMIMRESDTTVNRSLMTPLTAAFSTDKRWNNLVARTPSVGDIIHLYRSLASCVGKKKTTMPSEFTTSQLFLDVLDMMSNLVNWPVEKEGDVTGYEHLYRCITSGSVRTRTDRLLPYFHKRALADLPPGAHREQMYWLACNIVIPSLTPVFLSPIGGHMRWLSVIMFHGNLHCVAASPGVDSLQPDYFTSCSGMFPYMPQRATNLYAAITDGPSPVSVDECVKVLCRKWASQSLMLRDLDSNFDESSRYVLTDVAIL
jgi:hypothetical protein